MRIDRDVERRRLQLCEAAFQFAAEYLKVNKKTPSLRLFAARYGKAFRAIGMMLREGLESDHRFKITMISGGSYKVEVAAAHPIDRAIIETLADGAEHPEADILVKLKGSGYMMSDFRERALQLMMDGTVKVVAGRYSQGPNYEASKL